VLVGITVQYLLTTNVNEAGPLTSIVDCGKSVPVHYYRSTIVLRFQIFWMLVVRAIPSDRVLLRSRTCSNVLARARTCSNVLSSQPSTVYSEIMNTK
jgi:hypothetical protein